MTEDMTFHEHPEEEEGEEEIFERNSWKEKQTGRSALPPSVSQIQEMIGRRIPHLTTHLRREQKISKGFMKAQFILC